MEAVKTTRQTIADRFRAMEIGETIEFPFDEYNPSTIRSTPGSSLLKELHEGRKWRTSANMSKGCLEVTRIS